MFRVWHEASDDHRSTRVVTMRADPLDLIDDDPSPGRLVTTARVPGSTPGRTIRLRVPPHG